MSELDIDERILLTTITLIAEKGYKAVTTKEIAMTASVSEMTLFRHFGSKLRILEEAIERYYYSYPMRKIFDEQIEWQLEQDLLTISKAYRELVKKNREIILIAFKEGHIINGLLDQINKHPRLLKECLIEYFLKMIELGKVKVEAKDVEGIAMAFLYMHYGEFISKTFVAGDRITTMNQDEFIKISVELFAKALKP